MVDTWFGLRFGLVRVMIRVRVRVMVRVMVSVHRRTNSSKGKSKKDIRKTKIQLRQMRLDGLPRVLHIDVATCACVFTSKSRAIRHAYVSESACG